MHDNKFDSDGVEEVLVKYPGLRLQPITGAYTQLVGSLSFTAAVADKGSISDEYQIKILIPHGFPKEIPTVWEIGGRIPLSHHKFTNGVLCLGAPHRLSLMVSESPTILSFVDKCIIPYLYGYSYLTRHGVMPFGELSHGDEGICEDLRTLFEMHIDNAKQFFQLGSLRKRVANKLMCVCGSNRRLGKCHNKKINALRCDLGRAWFRRQSLALEKHLR